MKKLKYIFLLAGALSLASCESWLDEDPQYTINTKTIKQAITQVQKEPLKELFIKD